MKDGIMLDPQRGLNPHLAKCVACGSDTNEILLLGTSDRMYKCGNCDGNIIGGRNKSKCPLCNHTGLKFVRRVDEMERIATGFCDACKKKKDDAKQMVLEGGVFWRCLKCGSEGALGPNHPLSRKIRQDVPAPKPIGVEIEDGMCPICNKQEL